MPISHDWFENASTVVWLLISIQSLLMVWSTGWEKYLCTLCALFHPARKMQNGRCCLSNSPLSTGAKLFWAAFLLSFVSTLEIGAAISLRTLVRVVALNTTSEARITTTAASTCDCKRDAFGGSTSVLGESQFTLDHLKKNEAAIGAVTAQRPQRHFTVCKRWAVNIKRQFSWSGIHSQHRFRPARFAGKIQSKSEPSHH